MTLDFNTRLGIRKQWDQVGIMGVSLLFSGLPAEVWEDPYLVGTPRSDTDRDSSGLRLDWCRVVFIGFNVAHKRAVELECLDWQQLEVSQAGVAGAKIINRQAHP